MSVQDITIRPATAQDLPQIVAILAADPLGATRENVSVPLSEEYEQAFQAIDNDPNQLLAVATDDETVVGTFQLTFIPGLSRMGSWRCQIEAVRVAESHRNSGLGKTLFNWAIDKARSRNCKLVQLTTDKSRNAAKRFYDRLGFAATHEGYKLQL